MKKDANLMSVKILVVIYPVLISLVIVLGVPASLLVWVVCLALNEIAKVGQLVSFYLLGGGALAARQMLNGKLPQSVNAIRRKHNVSQR